MKPKTRRTVAIGIAAFFAYGLLLTVVSGDSRAAGDILRAVVALVVIAACGLGAWWIRTQPRRRSAEAAAYELGLRFSAADPFDLIDLPFALFNRLASVRGLENVMYGTWRGLEVKLFDYWYARSSDPSIDDTERFTCLIISLGTSWPSLLIEPETAAARLAGRITLKEIEFESEAFNRAFTVRGDDPRFASAFVDGRMMRWLLELPVGRWGFQIAGDALLCYRTPAVLPWALLDVLQTGSAFIDRTPSVVSSLYPAPPSMPPAPV
jgi:hypothetical protein